jgi:hypothetical protein
MGKLSPSGDYLRTSSDDVIVSRCVYCHLIVGASKELKKVEMAETVHDCPGKREADEADGRRK